jgi:hypothetical protein
MSFSSGLNAYLPLIVLALADRIGSAVDLDSPYSGISSNVGILILLLVLPIELIGDKIPKLDHLNDLLHTLVRPFVGAFCFMAIASQDDDLNVWLAGLLGLAIAGGTHLWKMRARPAITAGTMGLGNPWVSGLEDALAIVIAIGSIFLPVATLILVPVAAWLLQRTYRRMAVGEGRMVKPFLPRSTT